MGEPRPIYVDQTHDRKQHSITPFLRNSLSEVDFHIKQLTELNWWRTELDRWRTEGGGWRTGVGRKKRGSWKRERGKGDVKERKRKRGRERERGKGDVRETKWERGKGGEREREKKGRCEKEREWKGEHAPSACFWDWLLKSTYWNVESWKCAFVREHSALEYTTPPAPSPFTLSLLPTIHASIIPGFPLLSPPPLPYVVM